MNQQELLKLLNRYEEAYYAGESLISDEEYDALKEQYVSLYGEYEFVPSEGETGFIKVEHKYPLLSLDKMQINDKVGLRKELEKLWPVIIQPKFDGLSIEIQEEPKFITRGNGEIGDDVTKQCLQIDGATFIEPVHCSLRAEILMTHSAFKKINAKREEQGLKLFSNCRNAAAGMLRNLDLSKVEGLTIMLYEILGSTESESSDLELMYEQWAPIIDGTDIRITPYYKPKTIDDAINYLEKLEDYRKLIDYDIDGWVVKSDIENSLEVHGGYTGHHPKNAFAVKGEAKGAWTEIYSVTWQVGKENITPVAELNPVEIDGSIISRCTLHNISVMKALGLDTIYCDNYHKTEVFVIKANDVIPRITKVRHKIEEGHDEFNGYINATVNPPGNCPVCNGDTAIKESDSDSEILICTNPECKAKLQARIEHMANREALDITGLSEGTVVKLMKTFSIENPTDILVLKKEHLLELEGFAEKSAVNLENAITKAIKTQPVNKVLYASAIPLIGKDASNRICKYYTIDELSNILAKPDKDAVKDLCKVKGIGKETAQSLVDNKEMFRLMFVAIEKVTDVAVKDNNSNIEQKVFCITGQREPFKTIIEEAGHKVTGSVSKKTVALIAADSDLTTSKAIKAQSLGIPIISTEEQLRELL